MANLVIYDSQFGNTEKIAQAIAKNIPETKILRAPDASLSDLKNIKLLVVGSPTLGGRPTAAMQQFLDAIPSGTLKDIKVAVFDTRFSEEASSFFLKLIIKKFGYAAPKMAEILKSKGGKITMSPEGFIVKEKEGPLAEGELERAAKWIK